MKFFQHVYGRVGRGYVGSSPGYQLAALTDELATATDVIEKLNQLSFYNLTDAKIAEARYSFFRPAKGYLAFGRSQLARDRTRTAGAFAHHFVCTEDDFARFSASPIDLFEALKPQF